MDETDKLEHAQNSPEYEESLQDTGELRPPLEEEVPAAAEPEAEPAEPEPEATAEQTAPVPKPAPAAPAAAASSGLAEEQDLEAQLAYENLKRKRAARKRKHTITIAVAAVVALVVVAVLVFSGMSSSGEGSGESSLVATSVVYQGDLVNTITATGATEPIQSTVVTPEVDGIIENLNVGVGDHVNAGDVLFTLKNETLDKNVRTAERAVRDAERALTTADRAVDDAYAARTKAWNTANEAGDWSLYDEASLNSTIATAESALEAAKEALEDAKVALSEAQATADKRTVTAPVSGSIIAMNAVAGASTGGGSNSNGNGSSNSSGPLMQIADLSQMKVSVQVNEVDISSVKEGQEATATFSALPGVSLAATVQRIATVSNGTGDSSGGGAGGVVTYAVDLLIPNPDPALKPGMTASVSIRTQFVPNALIVPTSALWEGEDGKQFVTVAEQDDEGKTKSTRDVEVQVTDKNSSEAAVTGELADGDVVLLVGAGSGKADSADMGDDAMEV